tara:strand:+ start:494 stop:1720 length:1227 start_codon:yes stop_codon:yes gene_type:complete
MALACTTTLWSLDLLASSRERVQRGELQLPLRNLLAHANLWLARSTQTPRELFTVTTKPAVPSRSFNCSQHCFYSLGTYWWPNNATADGLPYVRRDGLVNPETFEYDSIPLSQMLFALSNLSLAYYFTRNASFAVGAAAYADVFFLDAATRMDPDVGLEHNQAIPGRGAEDEGRGTGIIDAKDLAFALDSSCLLDGAAAWGEARAAGLRGWARNYWGWMNHSAHARDEFASVNNHGTWYGVQALSLALHLGEREAIVFFARDTLRRVAEKVRPNGSLPLELARTRPLHYTWWDLQAFFELAWMARAVGVDAFGYVSPGGGSLRGALEWVLPFATGAKNYTKPEVTPFDHGKFFQVLRVASRVWPDGAARYEAAIPALKPGEVDYDGSALNLVWPRVEPAGVELFNVKR